LSNASPTDDHPAPLICFLDLVSEARPNPASLPDGADWVWARSGGRIDLADGSVTANVADDAIAALRACARLFPGRDVLLLSRDAQLPPWWWSRLLAAMQAAPQFDIYQALQRTQIDRSGSTRSLGEIDAACWAVADRQLVPTGRWDASFSLWRYRALDALRDEDAGGGLPVGMQAGTLDHLCIDASTAGTLPAMAADVLRARIDALGPQVLPHFGLDGRSVVLHVLHGWGGGAQRFVQDLARGDGDRHHLVLAAQSDSASLTHGTALALHADMDRAPLRCTPLAAPIATTALQSLEYSAQLERIRHEFGVGAVLVSSLIGHSLEALRTGLPTAVVCHDYYPLWPRLHADFDDVRQDFSSQGMAAALGRDLDAFEFRETRAAAWAALRDAYVDAVRSCDALLIAPSRSVQANLQRIEPRLAQRRWQQIEHGLDAWESTPPLIESDPARRALRVVVPGRIRGAKGEALLASLIPRLPEGVELVLLGGGAAAMRFFGQRGVHVLLDYRRDELPQLLAMLKPDLALLPSTVAETFSYTLSELWSLGLPVMATRLGSFAERIQEGRNGLLVAPDATSVACALQALRDDRAILDRLRIAPPAALRSIDDMARDYRSALFAPRRNAAPPRGELPAATTLVAQGEAIRRRDALTALTQQRDAMQIDLERRADWAHAQERLARERTLWAKTLEADNAGLRAHSTELEQEVTARGAWAQSLVAETERLQQLVASEQQRLEDELNRERAVFAVVREQRDQMIASSSWRLTRPLRWLRRTLQSLPARIAFRLKRVAALRHRLGRSLRSRGIAGTVARIRQEFRPPQPEIAFLLPQADDLSLPTLLLPDAPRASVIVPVYNHFHHTRTCLQALAACGDTTAFEVIVVDDGSSDETAERLADLPGLRFVRNPQNLGFIGACNAGAAQARGEYLVFLNNDTAVQPGWLDALLGTFATHLDVGLAGSKLVYPDGRLQEAGGIVFSDASGWNYGRFDDPADPRYNFVREVDYCSGAAIAITKELFDRFGGFDSHYAPAYYEDTDLAMKVRSAGRRVLYQPASVVVHFEGVTSGTDTAGSGTKRFQVINQQKFLERWRDVLATHPSPGTDIAIARQHRDLRRVLVIDATTPQPDHDSGSLRLVNFMRVLRAEGCAVTFFADNRAWVDGYTQALQQLGVEVLWHPWLSDPVRWFADNGRRFDLVFVSRHYILSSYIGLVRLHAPQARLVFDTVDLHYLREQREAELSGRDDQLRAAGETRAKELALIRSSDVTAVVSPVEQELLREAAPGARVDVISNVHEVFGRRRAFAARQDLMFVGGFQHPPNIDAVTWFVQEIFPQVRGQLPEVRFHIIGSKASEALRALGDVDGVQFHGFVADLEPFLDGCRLAVAPLRYGAGVKGKVNMSMSYGQPVVATPIAVEGMHAEDGIDVLVAQDAAAFADAVVRAYRDEALWTTLSDNAIENVRAHFSFDAARGAVRQLFS
jgi:O-antigen biosynthesis protein